MDLGRAKQQGFIIAIGDTKAYLTWCTIKLLPCVAIHPIHKVFVVTLDMMPTAQTLNGLGQQALHQVKLQMQSGSGLPPGTPPNSIATCASLATAKRLATQVFRIANNPAMRS